MFENERRIDVVLWSLNNQWGFGDPVWAWKLCTVHPVFFMNTRKNENLHGSKAAKAVCGCCFSLTGSSSCLTNLLLWPVLLNERFNSFCTCFLPSFPLLLSPAAQINNKLMWASSYHSHFIVRVRVKHWIYNSSDMSQGTVPCNFHMEADYLVKG